MNVKKFSWILLVAIFLIAPWLNSEITSEITIPKVSQEDVTFYEVNPCKVSLIRFVINNTESIYQNHYPNVIQPKWITKKLQNGFYVSVVKVTSS